MPIPSQKEITQHITSLYPTPEAKDADKTGLDATTQAHVDTWRSLVEAELAKVLAWTELTVASPAVIKVEFPEADASALVAAARVVDELYEKGYEALWFPRTEAAPAHISIRIR